MAYKKVTVQVPATSANCGPGFDCLGLACSLYNTFTYELLPEEAGIQISGKGSGVEHLPQGRSNLTVQSFYDLWEKLHLPPVGLNVTSELNVPMSRGLGSSSTAIVAGLVAANALAGSPLDKASLVTEATAIEGHPDNVAPAILGGITVNVLEQGQVQSLQVPLAKPLQLVAVVPECSMSTASARAVLPSVVPRQDAIYNVSRAALLVACFTTGNYEHLATALDDALHQPYRLPLMPGSAEAIKAAQRAGAYNGIISGAGSTLLAYVPAGGDVEKVGEAMAKPFAERNIRTTVHILHIDTEGAKILYLA